MPLVFDADRPRPAGELDPHVTVVRLRDRWGTIMPSTAQPVPPRVFSIDERQGTAPGRHERAE